MLRPGDKVPQFVISSTVFAVQLLLVVMLNGVVLSLGRASPRQLLG